MKWDYAELSKMAKANGGPEALVEMLIKSGAEQEKSVLVPKIFATGGLCLLVGAGTVLAFQKVKKHFSRRTITKEEVEVAKAELIQGIKDYDAAHENIAVVTAKKDTGCKEDSNI